MDERIEELTFVKETLSFDNKNYFIFQTKKGEHRLVEALAYQSFCLKPGMKISALIRKKGCAGEEISELLHPNYTQGKEYFFQIKRIGSLPFNNEVIYFAEIVDSISNSYKIRIKNIYSFRRNDIVKCRLEDQTDGRLKFVIV